jgi:hypothetical protein
MGCQLDLIKVVILASEISLNLMAVKLGLGNEMNPVILPLHGATSILPLLDCSFNCLSGLITLVSFSLNVHTAFM